MVSISKNKLILVIIAAALIGGVLTFMGTNLKYLTGNGTMKVDVEEYSKLTESYEQFEKLDTLIDTIHQNYYKDVKTEDLLTGAYRGIFTALGDEYSYYMTEEELEERMNAYNGEFYGVGAVFKLNEDGSIVINEVYVDSPAEEAGLKEGDILLSVDGEEMESLDEAVNNIRGEDGTTVTLEVQRGDEVLEIKPTRAKIEEKDLAAEIREDNIGVIQLNSFDPNTPDNFEIELDKMEEAGVKGIILDLRLNGGGSVDAAVEIADMLMDEGVIVSAEGKGENSTVYEASDGKTAIPIVVLAGQNTASASEILIAGLQSQGVKVIGETTYGKGITQALSTLTDETGFSITTSQFVTPDGEEIHEVGIEPDYKIEDLDEQFNKALSLLK